VIPTGKVVGTDRFRQPGWPAIAEEGRWGRPHPRLALCRPELATGGMATKLPWAAMAAGQHVQQRHGEGSGAVAKAAQDKGGGDDGASTGLIWMTVREWPAVMELKQQRRSWQRQRLCVGLERAGEGRGNERQRVEKSVPVLY